MTDTAPTKAGPDGTDVADVEFDDDLSRDVALPTFGILGRFRVSASSEEEAVLTVTRTLDDARERYDSVTLERRDDDQSWLVVARFVTVSIDAHTAVAGIHGDLHAAGLHPDEVWAER